MNRREKLEKVRVSQEVAKVSVKTVGETIAITLEEQAEKLKEILGAGVDINNIDDLLEKLGTIPAIQLSVEELKKTIADIHFPDVPKSVKIDGLESLLTTIKENQKTKETVIEKIDTKQLESVGEKLDSVIKAISDAKMEPSQAPGDYIPVRRVIKLGNNFYFDDNSTGTASGGAGFASGGSSSSGGDVNIAEVGGNSVGGTIPISGTVATTNSDITTVASAVKAEDSGHTTGDMGFVVLTKRTDTAATSANSDADYATLNTDNTGRVWVRVGATDSITPGTGATNLGKAEDSPHNSGDVGVMVLAVRRDDPNASVATADDYTALSTYRTGALRTAIPEEDFAALGSNHVKKYYTNSGAVTDGIVWSPAVGKRWYVTDIFINVSAAATVTLEDDKVSGDEVVWKSELAANSGWSHSFATPLFSGEDAADLLITTSAGNVYVTITGYEI